MREKIYSADLAGRIVVVQALALWAIYITSPPFFGPLTGRWLGLGIGWMPISTAYFVVILRVSIRQVGFRRKFASDVARHKEDDDPSLPRYFVVWCRNIYFAPETFWIGLALLLLVASALVRGTQSGEPSPIDFYVRLVATSVVSWLLAALMLREAA